MSVDAATVSQQKNVALFRAAVFLIFILAVGVRWYCYTYKTSVHLDESTSVILSTYNEVGWAKHFDDDVMYTGDEMRRLAYTVSPGLSGLGRDLFRIRMDNRDPPHSNLYYSFYRIALTGLDAWDAQSLLWRGNMLNLFFFSLSFGLLLCLARLLFAGDRNVILLSLLVAVINPAALSNSLFVRSYQLQETLFIALALMTVWYVLRMRSDKPCPGYALFFAHALTLGLCLLSGYFAFFYVPLLGLVLLRESWVCRQRAYIPYFAALTVLGVLLGFALYASFMVGLFIDRGAEAAGKTSLYYFLSNVSYLLDKLIYLYGKHVLSTGGTVLLVSAALLSWGRLRAPLTRLSLVMLLVCAFWSFAIFVLAPYKTLRYFMSVAPLVVLFACALFQHARYRRFLMPIFAVCVLSQNFMPGNVEHFKASSPLAPQEAPYIASFTDAEYWRPGSFLPYITDSQRVIFYNNCTKLRAKIFAHGETFLLVDDEQYRHCRLSEIPNLQMVKETSYFFIYSISALPSAASEASHDLPLP